MEDQLIEHTIEVRETKVNNAVGNRGQTYFSPNEKPPRSQMSEDILLVRAFRAANRAAIDRGEMPPLPLELQQKRRKGL